MEEKENEIELKEIELKEFKGEVYDGKYRIVKENVLGNEERFSVNHPQALDCLKIRDVILLENGLMKIEIISIEEDGVKGEGMIFKDKDEAMMAYQDGAISIHAKIKVRMFKEIDGEMKSKKIETSVGRIIFNEAVRKALA